MTIDFRMLLIGLGIALGALFFHRTGYSPGGIITPGFLALALDSPERIVTALIFGGIVALLLSLLERAGLYGRTRTAAALLIALVLRALAGRYAPISEMWVGWVVPGLIGADMQRQGVVPTVGAALSTAVAAAMAASLLISARGLL